MPIHTHGIGQQFPFTLSLRTTFFNSKIVLEALNQANGTLDVSCMFFIMLEALVFRATIDYNDILSRAIGNKFFKKSKPFSKTAAYTQTSLLQRYWQTVTGCAFEEISFSLKVAIKMADQVPMILVI